MNFTIEKFYLVLRNTKLPFFPPKNSCGVVSDAEVQSPCVFLWDQGDVNGKSVP